MDNRNIFAENLKRHMDRSGKSRYDVCNALGFSYYTFSSWVNGKKYPRMDKVEMLAEYFGIKKSDLIERNSIEDNPVEMAELHVEILQDEDLMEMLPDFWKLDSKQKRAVIDLVHTLAETKTEA